MDSDVIGIVGSLVTVLGIFVTIYFAKQADKHRKEADKHEKQAQKYSNQTKSDLRKVKLSNCTEILKKMLEDIRRLPLDINQLSKGIKIENIISTIKSHFDDSLSLIDITNEDQVLRDKLSNAQKILHEYEKKYLAQNADLSCSYDLRIEIQDCISIINTKIFNVEV